MDGRTRFSAAASCTGRIGTVLFLTFGLLVFDRVLVPVEALALVLSPNSLEFSATQGGANPATQVVTLDKKGDRLKTWTVTTSAPWITVSATSGTISTEVDQITVGANVSGFVAGSYQADITIAVVGRKGLSNKSLLPVTLTVAATTLPPAIGLSPTSLSFSGTAGGTNPAAKSVSISNTGGGTLTWTASDNATWLTPSPMSGTNAGTVTASVSLTALAAGTYNATITVAATGATTKTLPVSLTVNPVSTSSSATLSWNANTESDVAGYKIYRANASGAYGAPLGTVPTATTSYVANGLQAGTTYFFAITAYDSAGNESAFSNEVSKSIY